MAKQLRRLMLLVAVLALTACAAMLLARPAQETPAAEPVETVRPLLPQSPVQQVDVRNSHGSYAVSPTGVEGLPEELLETASLETLFDGLNALALEKLEGTAAEDPIYGLTQPAAEIRLHYETGESLSLGIGVKEGVSKRYYCRVNGEEAVYLMNGAVAERLLLNAQSYLSLQVTPDCLASSTLSAIGDICFVTKETEIQIRSAGGGDGAFQRQLLSFGAVTHVVEGPGILHELNRTYAQEIFASLFDLYARDIVAYGLTEEDLLERGFAEPDLTVQFSLRNGDAPETPVQPYTLRLLRQEDGSWWAAVNERGVIYHIDAAAFMQAEYTGFVNRWFFSPLLSDLKALCIATPQEEHLYQLSGTAADLQVTKAEQEISLSRFRSFYTLVVSAASNGDALGLPPLEQEPVLTVEFLYQDADKAPDVLELLDLDDRRCAVAVNGVVEFAMRRNYVQALLEAINALETGAEIPQTW